MINVTTVTQKGQVTIPLDIRKKLGIKTGHRIQFSPLAGQPNKFVINPIADIKSLKGKFKSGKRYTKKAARQAYISDVISGKI